MIESKHNGSAKRRTLAAHRAIAQIGSQLDLNLWIELWDGARLPLGSDVTSGLTLSISSPGVISSLLRRPSLDRLLRHYIFGHISVEGGTLIDLGNLFAFRRSRKQFKKLDRWQLIRCATPFLFAGAEKLERGRGFGKGEVGSNQNQRNEKDLIQFHYDVGNDFYRLFLDERMIYTCGYFTNPNDSLDQAQRDKLEMICRKLRLKPGERFLDIGCGWGGLICYAAENFGVEAHGVTLSQEQRDYAMAEIERRGLSDKVSIELKDYRDLTEQFDKIASVGMYEHIGVAAIPEYNNKIRSLLRPQGLFLNHGITRRSKRKKRRYASRPEQRALLRYIFPGCELDDIGHTVTLLEQARFEVHDVENWRDHYAQTTRRWCERLTANRDAAVALVGDEVYRIWVAYLAGSSLGFARGSMNIYQTLTSRAERGPAPVPATRADLYR